MTSTDDALILGDAVFPVTKASFMVSGDELLFEVDCGEPSNVDDEHDWSVSEPRLYTEGTKVPRGSTSSLIKLTKANAADLVLYLFEHDPVVVCEGVLSISGGNAHLELAGKAEVLGETFSFQLRAKLDRR